MVHLNDVLILVEFYTIKIKLLKLNHTFKLGNIQYLVILKVHQLNKSFMSDKDSCFTCGVSSCFIHKSFQLFDEF